MANELSDSISSALRALKGTVGVLREGDQQAPLEPIPGLAQLPELADSFGTAGLAVITTTTGAARPLPPAVDLTAFRVIQAAMARPPGHGPRATGHGPRATSGYGLAGMRERATSVGGNLQTGHRAAGGFEVTARVSLRTQPQSEDAAR